MYCWNVVDFHLHICFIWSAVLPSMRAVAAATIMKECVLYWHGLYQAQRNADFKMEQAWKRVTPLWFKWINNSLLIFRAHLQI
jgi:hypothetical protein